MPLLERSKRARALGYAVWTLIGHLNVKCVDDDESGGGGCKNNQSIKAKSYYAT